MVYLVFTPLVTALVGQVAVSLPGQVSEHTPAYP